MSWIEERLENIMDDLEMPDLTQDERTFFEKEYLQKLEYLRERDPHRVAGFSNWYTRYKGLIPEVRF